MKVKATKKNATPISGFTLLEILIAIFICVLMLSAVFTAYQGTLGIIDETQCQENIYQMARTAMERICGDLESAYFPEMVPSPGTDPATIKKGIFKGEKKDLEDLRWGELRFLSLAHITFSDVKFLAEPAEIAYYGVPAQNANVLDLYRSDIPLACERHESGSGGVLLCKGLSSIDFIYYDEKGDPHEDWNSEEGPSKGNPPSRVAIFMEFPNLTDPKHPFRFATGIAIPIR